MYDSASRAYTVPTEWHCTNMLNCTVYIYYVRSGSATMFGVEINAHSQQQAAARALHNVVCSADSPSARVCGQTEAARTRAIKDCILEMDVCHAHARARSQQTSLALRCTCGILCYCGDGTRADHNVTGNNVYNLHVHVVLCST